MAAPRRLAASLAIVSLALIALAACGGSSSPSTTTSKPKGPTKAQYVHEVDAICATVKSQTAPLVKQVVPLAEALVIGGTANAATKLVSLVSTLHTDAAADLTHLRALAEPPGAHAAVQRFLEPLSTIVASVGQAVTTLRSKTPSNAVGLLSQLSSTAQQVKTAARAYGLVQCEQVLPL
jgi:4-diphosphocytidyl-2C-methyl-D-erythritol kinase